MCLITNQKNPIILSEDLNVVKILQIRNNEILSAYYHTGFIFDYWVYFKYEIGKLYQTNILETVEKFPMDFLDNQILYEFRKNNPRGQVDSSLKYFGQGYHSLKEERLSHMSLINKVVFNCVIPAGSEVYYGLDDRLIISNQIIIKDRYEK